MKPVYNSKTIWVNLAMAVLAFFPQVQAMVTPEIQGMIVMGVNWVLRFVTKEGVALS